MAVRFIADVERDKHVLYPIINTDKKGSKADADISWPILVIFFEQNLV